MASIANEGTVAFRVHVNDPAEWAQSVPMRFPPIKAQGIEISTLRTKEKALRVSIFGLFGGRTFAFSVPQPELLSVPPGAPVGFHVGISWEKHVVKLYLNGANVATTEITP